MPVSARPWSPARSSTRWRARWGGAWSRFPSASSGSSPDSPTARSASVIDEKGDPAVIEFNCRFGDPETQPVMMRLKSSLVDLILAGLDGRLPSSADWHDEVALGIVLASRGYPESSSSNDVITGLPQVNSVEKVKVFHAGTKQGDNGQILTNGGRVLCVTALGADVAEAQARALQACGTIAFDGIQYRRDIGWRAIGR